MKRLPLKLETSALFMADSVTAPSAVALTAAAAVAAARGRFFTAGAGA